MSYGSQLILEDILSRSLSSHQLDAIQRNLDQAKRWERDRDMTDRIIAKAKNIHRIQKESRA